MARRGLVWQAGHRGVRPGVVGWAPLPPEAERAERSGA
jgi:hypothetical protein